jgi:16S rRNA (guanine(1405)-N(7))-methyltransferase
MEIYGKSISKEKEDFIIHEVQDKKELRNFSESYILSYAEHLLKKDKKLLEMISSKDKLSSKSVEKLVKLIRDRARRIYGVYIPGDYVKFDKLLSECKFKTGIKINNLYNIDLVKPLIELHVSSEERKDSYLQIYKKIVEVTGTPTSVLDLACGLNPIGIYYLASVCGVDAEKINYFASDFGEKDCLLLQSFFDKAKLHGKAFRLDLSDEKEHVKLHDFCNSHKVDWCLMFKALDPVEETNEDVTYKLLPSIKAKWIVVSFPTITIARNDMNNPRRNWFEKVLNRLDYNFQYFELNKELFYVISKK